MLLAEAGHELVAEAADRLAGGAVGVEHRPGLGIMDRRMPERDGVEATRRIHASAPNVPVIAYSSADAAAVRDAFLAAGAVAYVEKPDIAGLQRAVAQIAERT